MSVLKNSKYKKEILAINKRLKEEGLLKMDCVIEKHKTYKDFLIALIDNYVNYHKTLSVETGKVTDTEELHRSTMDLYKISKFYYPRLMFHELIYTLVDLVNTNKIATTDCDDIKQTTWYTFDDEFNRNYCNQKFENINFIDKKTALNRKELLEISKEYEEYAKNK
jgi:hypothetical protein